MSKAVDKGSKWRKRIEDFLANEGIHPRRQALYGLNDRGDIHVGPYESPVVIEAKDRARHDLSGWLDEANEECGNAGGQLGVVWFHRRGRSDAAGGYVLMSGQDFAYLLREAGLT